MKLLAMVLVLLFHFFLVAAASSVPSPSVIVVGAGMSGIVAAKTLHDAGIRDILILEASPRIGGRICRTQFGGHVMEMGASWYFGGGPLPSPLLDIGKRLKIQTYPTNFGNLQTNTYKQEGGLYPEEVATAAVAATSNRFQFCSNFSKMLNSKLGKDEDMSVFGAFHVHKRVPINRAEMVVDYFDNDFIDGDPPRVTSLKHKYPRHELVDHGTDFYFVKDPRGFESMVHYVANQFLTKRDPRLQLNKVVRETSYSKNGVTVKTEDGSVYQAKYAIVSVSLGVLQSNLIEFKPEFPLWKRVAISDFSMTIYTKIFLKFPSTFWPTGPESEILLYAHKKRGYFPIWKHLENEFPGSNILYATVTGEEAVRIEQQPDEVTKAETTEVLRKMFGNNIPNPEAILVSRWWSNRFFKGAYANWPAGYTQRRYQQLKEPIGPIYFTGEHTSEKYMGYVSGAYLSGIDSANELIKCLEKQPCKGQ